MNLGPPRLFQLDRSTGVLDLQRLNPPNPGKQGDQGDPVVVSILLPDATESSLVVWFGEKNKIFPITNARLTVMECCFERSELPSSGNVYSVYYEYGENSSPPVNVTLLDSMAHFVPRYIGSVHGVYPPGSTQNASLIDAWIVPGFRLLLKNDPVIESTETLPSVDVDLKLMWMPFESEMNEIGEISYRAASGQWSVALHFDCVSLQKSDLILIQSEVAADQFVSFKILL